MLVKEGVHITMYKVVRKCFQRAYNGQKGDQKK